MTFKLLKIAGILSAAFLALALFMALVVTHSDHSETVIRVSTLLSGGIFLWFILMPVGLTLGIKYQDDPPDSFLAKFFYLFFLWGAFSNSKRAVKNPVTRFFIINEWLDE